MVHETTAGYPVWLDRIDDLLQRDGFSPDGEIAISIRRSVPELTGAWSSSRAPYCLGHVIVSEPACGSGANGSTASWTWGHASR